MKITKYIKVFIYKHELFFLHVWYKFHGHRYYNALGGVVIWNRKTKFLNDLRFKDNDFAALFWQ